MIKRLAVIGDAVDLCGEAPRSGGVFRPGFHGLQLFASLTDGVTGDIAGLGNHIFALLAQILEARPRKLRIALLQLLTEGQPMLRARRDPFKPGIGQTRFSRQDIGGTLAAHKLLD